MTVLTRAQNLRRQSIEGTLRPMLWVCLLWQRRPVMSWQLGGINAYIFLELNCDSPALFASNFAVARRYLCGRLHFTIAVSLGGVSVRLKILLQVQLSISSL